MSYTRTRWPGWDGWLLAAMDVFAIVVAGWKSMGGFGGPLIAGCVITALYWALTYGLRRPRRTAPAPVDGIRILTVVPTKDNAGSIEAVVTGCLAYTQDVLVVDDGCTDGTPDLARSAGAIVVSHETNRGKGAALETALDWAAAEGFSHIVAIDADGQHKPSDLPSFYEAIRRNPGAVIAGVRDMSDAPKGAQYARANSNFWVWVETSQRMGDTQCGYRAYPVGPTRDLLLVPSRYQWEVEVLVRSVWAGTPVVDHPCEVYYPPREERVSSYRKFVDTARITWLNAHLIAERILWPPRWFPGRRSWQGSHRGFTAGWALYLWVLKTFGRRPVQIALVPLVVFYWVFLGEQAAGLDAYLKRRRPERGTLGHAWDRLQILLQFAYSLVDRFDVLIGGADDITLDRTAVPGLAEKLYGEDADQGLMMISGHLGNPDIAGSLLRGKERAVHLLLYQAPTDPYFAMMQRTLGDRAPKVIAINDGGQVASLAALRALRDGGVVAAKGDRVVDDRKATCTFLGDEIEVPTGPFLLAALAGVPVLFTSCFRTPDGYRFEAVGPRVYAFESRKTRDADLARWAQEWVDVMEGWTEKYPLQWYNFFDPWNRP